MLYKFVLSKKKKKSPTKKIERGKVYRKDSINFDSKHLSKSSLLVYTQFLMGNKIIYNFKLKILAQKNSR